SCYATRSNIRVGTNSVGNCRFALSRLTSKSLFHLPMFVMKGAVASGRPILSVQHCWLTSSVGSHRRNESSQQRVTGDGAKWPRPLGGPARGNGWRSLTRHKPRVSDLGRGPRQIDAGGATFTSFPVRQRA